MKMKTNRKELNASFKRFQQLPDWKRAKASAERVNTDKLSGVQLPGASVAARVLAE